MRPKKEKKEDMDPDAPLIEAINGGGMDLFPELVRRYEQKLYNFGFRMCNNAQDAEDLVQETFMNIFKSLNNFRFESKFTNWMYKIAARVCLKKRRKKTVADEQNLSLEDLAARFRNQAPEETPKWARQPIDRVLDSELAEIIKRTVALLPPRYRVVLVLRDMEELTTQETAQVLGISTANVKVRLHRARLLLRDKLQGYMAHA
ncbi:MAG: RNA polymerase sigma factor [Deltaproteobacteria bacterium]|nr:RNA polymerase sigma factor [Deltaproteobacteria bacterium]MBW1954230.1 RNA polymerase sigma factor [Deltaproteobacteria bacterium]MBW2041631.1 RNA polymerase sigma factor [Deltaproteobacteria bacterium]MBW2131089.1 RNA polymerase sigma factor [Deltaproteobacteria bacterium]